MITYDKLQLKISFDELRHGVGVNITAQFIKKKLEVRFGARSNPAQGLAQVSDDENLLQ